MDLLKGGSSYFSQVTRGNSLKLYQGKFRLEIRNNFFPKGIIKQWNRLPRDLVELPSLEVFKSVDVACVNMGYWGT